MLLLPGIAGYFLERRAVKATQNIDEIFVHQINISPAYLTSAILYRLHVYVQ